ncbi:MAG: tetratricopeptide repeat protein [Paludibacteraceae bacterium]|nr:tetratricopeptide repeat protein [Paludibacteraceae bacterium]
MTKELKSHITSLLDRGNADAAIKELEAYVSASGNDDEAYMLLGNAYRKKENWEGALNSYSRAIEINPSSPAKDAYDMIIQILNFYDTDRYNV